MSEFIEDGDDGEVRVKVTDRRKFDSGGKRRPDAAPQDEPEQADKPAAAPAPRPKAAAADKPSHPADQAPEGTADQAAAQEEASGTSSRQEAAAGQVDFQSFVYFLYMSALHELGIPTQEGGEPRPADLERARFFVEVLRLLEVKTKGNLDPGETKLLEEALYNLRMQYVGISQKSSSEPPSRQP
jgi:hypothetical protein